MNRYITSFLLLILSGNFSGLYAQRPEGRIATADVAPLIRLCPNLKKHRSGGDREFGGPVEVRGAVELRRNGSKLFADVDLSFREKNGDTWIRYRETVPVDAGLAYYEAVQGFFPPISPWADKATQLDRSQVKQGLRSVIMPHTFPGAGGEFGGCNDGKVFSFPSHKIKGNLVQELHIIADTGGDDVSEDDNCHCDTRVEKITFKPFGLLIKDGKRGDGFHH
jgi:hypothetical protein